MNLALKSDKINSSFMLIFLWKLCLENFTFCSAVFLFTLKRFLSEFQHFKCSFHKKNCNIKVRKMFRLWIQVEMYILFKNDLFWHARQPHRNLFLFDNTYIGIHGDGLSDIQVLTVALSFGEVCIRPQFGPLNLENHVS